MITIGLTGNIAMGKSTVSKTFEAVGIHCIDADIIAREVVMPGTFGLIAIKDRFGIDMILPDGTLDRAKLGEVVFNSPAKMTLLNELMLPLIRVAGDNKIKKLHDLGHPIVVWDGSLIVESGHAEKFRPLIVVHCTPEQQLDRLMRRNGLTRENAMRRIEAQMPVEKKKNMADYLIDTNGTIEQSVEQTKNIIEEIRRRYL
jgi:dephospho-CoA kinase